MKLRYFGDKILRKVSKSIDLVDEGLLGLAEDMVSLMFEESGIGLAAPQIGKNIRLIVLGIPKAPDGFPTSPGEMMLIPRMPLILFNPVLSNFSEQTITVVESCLSGREVEAEVTRPEFLDLEFLTPRGAIENHRCGGMLARCLQHEVDHLDGIIFTDRVDNYK